MRVWCILNVLISTGWLLLILSSLEEKDVSTDELGERTGFSLMLPDKINNNITHTNNLQVILFLCKDDQT